MKSILEELKFMCPGVECHQGKILQELLEHVRILVYGSPGSARRCSKVTKSNTLCLVSQAGIEVSSQNPAVSSWKSFERRLQFCPKG